MDDRLQNPTDPGWILLHRGNLLGPAIRRDIADLNRLFLELGVEDALEEDPRFAVAETIRRALRACDADARNRLADAPFCLFHLRLPTSLPVGDRVADARPPAPLDALLADRCQAFVLLALSVARHLAGGTPLTPRIVLGVAVEEETRLAALTPSDVARIASQPGLVRPRWPRHERFWAMLVGAAREGDPVLLRWAHCAGLCLITAGADTPIVPLDPTRGRPRRPRGAGGPGLSC